MNVDHAEISAYITTDTCEKEPRGNNVAVAVVVQNCGAASDGTSDQDHFSCVGVW